MLTYYLWANSHIIRHNITCSLNSIPVNTTRIVGYTPVSKRRLCKQLPLLDKARNQRTMGLCNRFLYNSSINTFPRQGTPTQQQKNDVFYVICAEIL
jgi:hypothetical protein